MCCTSYSWIPSSLNCYYTKPILNIITITITIVLHNDIWVGGYSIRLSRTSRLGWTEHSSGCMLNLTELLAVLSPVFFLHPCNASQSVRRFFISRVLVITQDWVCHINLISIVRSWHFTTFSISISATQKSPDLVYQHNIRPPRFYYLVSLDT